MTWRNQHKASYLFILHEDKTFYLPLRCGFLLRNHSWAAECAWLHECTGQSSECKHFVLLVEWRYLEVHVSRLGYWLANVLIGCLWWSEWRQGGQWWLIALFIQKQRPSLFHLVALPQFLCSSIAIVKRMLQTVDSVVQINHNHVTTATSWGSKQLRFRCPGRRISMPLRWGLSLSLHTL